MGKIVPKDEKPIKITMKDIKNYLCPTCTQSELALALNIIKTWGLNPFKREIHIVKYKGKPAQIIVGYEYYLKKGLSHPKMNGYNVQIGYYGDTGSLEDMYAKITIWRKDWDYPFEHTVDYSEYVQYKQDGTITKFWRKMPKTMLKKVAIAQGFRMCFSEFAGMPYADAELGLDINEPMPQEVEAEVIEDDETQELSVEKPKKKLISGKRKVSEFAKKIQELINTGKITKKQVGEIAEKEGIDKEKSKYSDILAQKLYTAIMIFIREQEKKKKKKTSSKKKTAKKTTKKATKKVEEEPEEDTEEDVEVVEPEEVLEGMPEPEEGGEDEDEEEWQ